MPLVSRWNSSVPRPAHSSVVDTLKPVSSGTSTVAKHGKGVLQPQDQHLGHAQLAGVVNAFIDLLVLVHLQIPPHTSLSILTAGQSPPIKKTKKISIAVLKTAMLKGNINNKNTVNGKRQRHEQFETFGCMVMARFPPFAIFSIISNRAPGCKTKFMVDSNLSVFLKQP